MSLFEARTTKELIATKPLASALQHQPQQIAKWIDSVAPTTMGAQSSDVTEVILSYLMKKGITDQTMAQALDLSVYDWELPMSGIFIGVGVQLRVIALQKPKRESMSAAKKVDIAALKLRAAELDAKYTANIHNPEVTKALIKALIDLLGQAGEAFSDMQKDKEKIEAMQREILLNARNLGALIRYVGPYELHMMRKAPTPDRGTQYQPPNLRRPTPRGR